jgi:signal transduction histidine kinase
MKFPVRLPISWRPGNSGTEAEGRLGAPAVPKARPEDTRILRRTRLRLMAVSGVVTLVILVALGVAAYAVVARAIDDSEKTVLQHYMDRHLIEQPTTGGPEAAELGGETANVFEIYVTPAGLVIPPRGVTTLPVGLPDAASDSAARTSAQGTDQRSLTASDGTNYTIVTVQAIGPGNQPGWLIQFVQNRSADVRLLATLTWVLLLAGGVAMLASLLAGYLYAGRALVPIRASMDRREGALQRQREFAANASHELRTPLTVIGASVEDLKRNRRSRVEDVGEALDDIEAEVHHMTALVEDMLLLARTDSGVVQVEHQPVDLGDVAAEAASVLVTLGHERQVGVLLEPLPAPLTGDPIRLRQLVTILVDNAIRHSPAGATVRVLVRAEGASAVLEVADQGPGIKPADLPRLFERFWRADNAPAGGTGLGLSIARWIVEQHGGTIEAHNQPEGGASFIARLPLATPGGPVLDSSAFSGESDADEPDVGAAGVANNGYARMMLGGADEQYADEQYADEQYTDEQEAAELTDELDPTGGQPDAAGGEVAGKPEPPHWTLGQGGGTLG